MFINILHKKFLFTEKCNRQSQLLLSDFQMFWEWFGATCHHYRHNKGIRTLYLQGLIFGFVSKENCSLFLAQQRQGTFIIRNSQASNDGAFTLAYLNSNGLIRHSKIDPKKLAPPYGSLPDYLRDKKQLHYVLRPFIILASGDKHPNYVVQGKSDAFSKYCSPVKESADDYYLLY